MNDKRFQLFGLYSMSIILITSLFSIAIYLNVSITEQRRVGNELQSIAYKISNQAENLSLKEIEKTVLDNNITVSFWFEGEEQPQLFNKGNISTVPRKPRKMNELESISVIEYLQVLDQKQRVQYYSYATGWRVNDRKVTVQLLYNSHGTTLMLSNLTNILVLGTIGVSIVGIGLGVLLAYLNMIPVVEAWVQQRSFVADASHELRTPLSVITLKSDSLLKNSDDTIYDHIEDVAVIQQECRRMHKMVDSLLFLAKKDSGVVDLELTEFRVQQLLNDLKVIYVEFFEIEEKEFIIDNNYKEHVLGDYEKIKQACMIIIDNALRFTDEGNYVKISVEVKSGRVIFTISNNGKPLNPKEIPFIFERFYKGDESRSKESNEGNGLGLSIAQEILTLHQSKIRAYVQNDITHFSFSLQKK